MLNLNPKPTEEKVADLLLHLEAERPARLVLTAWAAKQGRHAQGYVVFHEGGRRHVLDAFEARLMARCLRDDHGDAEGPPAEWIEALESAAESADRQASAILLGLGAGAGITPARRFGGRA